MNEQIGDEATPEWALTPERRLESNARRLRLAAAIFGSLVVAVVLWALYEGPDKRVAIELAMFVTLALAASAFAFQVAQLLVDEPLSEVVRVIFGEPLSIRNSDRFIRRLQHECNEKQFGAHHRAFSLIVIGTQERTGEPPNPVGHLTGAVRASIRAKDVLGEVGPNEIWVLALGAGADAAEVLTERLAARLDIRNDSTDPRAAHIGWSTVDVDASDAHALLRAARYRASIFNPGEQQEQIAA